MSPVSSLAPETHPSSSQQPGQLPPERWQAKRLDLPDTLTRKLRDFRGYVWATKLTESLVAAAAIVLLAYLVVYVSDRFVDTHVALRWTIFLVALSTLAAVPNAMRLWLWNHRRHEQLARLLRLREPAVGDELLSAIELANNISEQGRSPVLCQAAIGQVAERAKQLDFRRAAPRHRLMPYTGILAVSLAGAVLLGLLYPIAAGNAWARFIRPWGTTPRYTFTSIQPLPNRIVVAHGEATSLTVTLKANSASAPKHAQAYLGSLPLPQVPIDGQQYAFQLPPQTSVTPLSIQIGDFYQTTQIEPKTRPELLALTAKVTLPEYLSLDQPTDVDVRTGVLSVVEGSQAILQATASRDLQHASVLGRPVPVNGTEFASDKVVVSGEEATMAIRWRDYDGLAGSADFQLQIKPLVDEAPSIIAQDLPRQCVVLESEQINFRALASDDFGVKRIGIYWRGLDENSLAPPAKGEKILAAGGPDQSSLQVSATFCATALGIAAQPIELTVWVEDYLPDRPRVESPQYLLFVLTADEHAVWIASQMSKWQRAALDVRDVELQLHQSNQLLHQRASSELTNEQFRQELLRQAALEQANGLRLSALTGQGAELLRQAARNSDIAVGELDEWARMLEVLRDISSNRMPSVTQLLKQAAGQLSDSSSGQSSANKPESGVPEVGQVRATVDGASQASEQQSEEGQSEEDQRPDLPRIADVESTMQTPDSAADRPPANQSASDRKQPAAPPDRLLMPQTVVIGPTETKSEEEQPTAPDPPAPLEDAVQQQQELLAEFEKLSDDLNAVLANLEGSTLVKRLKSAAREQNLVAEKIATRIETVFGRADQLKDEDRSVLFGLAETERSSGQTLSFIMDDMQAYYERRRTSEFKLVLDDMKSSEVLVALQRLSDDLQIEQGLSIAAAEYWADTLDRWAEDLVESGESPSQEKEKESGSSESLPPSIILEMLKILEAEVNLREQTRVAQQAQPAVQPDQHLRDAQQLSEIQYSVQLRTEKVSYDIGKLPEAEKNFAQEINLLGAVSQIMLQSGHLLSLGETGSQTIAAQTEAIEILLQSKRINPKGGGDGGGASPGGGAADTSADSALALIGAGLNQNERRELRDTSQAVGRGTDRVLPEEFRAGLDAYFQRLESQ